MGRPIFAPSAPTLDVPPLGILDTARPGTPNPVTWQPQQGVRIAAVAVSWTDGTVLAARSLREVERETDSILMIVVAAWVVMLVALAAGALAAAVLWESL